MTKDHFVKLFEGMEKPPEEIDPFVKMLDELRERIVTLEKRTEFLKKKIKRLEAKY